MTKYDDIKARVRTLPKPVGTIYMGYGGTWMIVTEAGAVPYRRVA